MEKVRFGTGIAEAAQATGTTIVIDTFRAFTTAAVLFEAGVETVYLSETLDQARALARAVGGLLCGEDDGRRPPDFDLSNSPHEAAMRTDLGGATIVQRTSAGTRSVVAALRAGAHPVYAASLVVASATAAVVSRDPEITIISSGLHGTEPAVEDDLTAALIADRIMGSIPDPQIGQRIRSCDRAMTLASAPWANPGDVDIASATDKYSFAMEAFRDGAGRVQLRRLAG